MEQTNKKLLSKSWILIIIVALLFIQANFDLALPTYTASIIDTGLTQYGIESTTPAAITEKSLEEMLLYCTDDQQQILKDIYSIKNKPSNVDLIINTQDNVLWANEELLTDENQQLIESILIKQSVLNEFAEQINNDTSDSAMVDIQADNSFMSPEIMESAKKLISENDTWNFGMSAMLKAVPQSIRTMILNEIDKKISVFEVTMTQPMAIKRVVEEYRILGVDINTIQRNSVIDNGLKMLIIALLNGLVAISVAYLSSRYAGRFGQIYRSAIYNKVMNFSKEDMEKFSIASLITRSTNDIQQIQNMLVFAIRVVVYAPILAIGGIIKAYDVNSNMLWIIVVGIIAVMIIVLFMFILGVPKMRMMQSIIDKLNLVTREILTGLPVIRAFVSEKAELDRFDEANIRLKKTQLFVNKLMSGMMPIMMLVMNGITLLILWVGAINISDGNMQVGSMMAYMQYAIQIVMAFLMISIISIVVPRAVVAYKRVNEVLTIIPKITQKEDYKYFEQKSGIIQFENVSYMYKNAKVNAITDITFTIEPGKTTAILGGTGSGKTTLLNLIPRFYDISAGSIKFDNVSISDANIKELRNRIGYVPQKISLFSGTVNENIAFGSEIIDKEKVKKAAAISQAEEFIINMSDGYDSKISQSGKNISGGQKQRIAIARALYMEPEVLIFDDSFSALDFKTERQVYSGIVNNYKDTSILIVAQRISSVMNADEIVVMDEGKIVGKGKHDALMKTCEVYRQIAFSQLSKEELDNASR